MDIVAQGYSLLSNHIDTVTLVLGVASAILGGVFFAFSMFVMAALGNLKPAEGIRAMQRINIDVFCRSFMLLFLGLPVVMLCIGVMALLNLTEPYAIRLLLAASVFLVGVFMVTVLGNVPLNNTLAGVNTGISAGEGERQADGSGIEPSANALWVNYQLVWQRWNTLRAFACLVSSVVLLV